MPRSRSRGEQKEDYGAAKECDEIPTGPKKEKEFAWMDSEDDEAVEKGQAATPPGSPVKSPVRDLDIHEVETLAQMARLAPGLEKRLRRGELRSRELCDVAEALARSKYFDQSLFGPLSSELSRAFRRGRLGPSDILQTLCSLAELNAYNAEMFEAGCKALRPEVQHLQEPQRQRLEAAFKKANNSSTR